MRLSRLLAGLLLATVPATDATAATPRPGPPASGQSKRVPTEHRVTLITGDKVVVRSQPGQPDEVRFQPGRGSGSTAATIVRGNGRVRVVPSSAYADLVAGRLDPALFDVGTLIANGYDDARSAVLPTIVEYAGTTATARRSAAQDKLAGTKRARLLTSIGARGAAVGKATAAQFWQSVTSRARVDTGIRRIHLDRRVRASLDRSVAQIGAPAAWQRGLTGRGVQVAVLDTGIDVGHPDLTGKVVRAANFSESPETTDRIGHGTHVAGTVAGTGAASGGSYRGVAPDATLLNGKVLGDDGSGSWSGVIAGMEWAVAQGADVVNMSLGGDPTDGTDPVSEAVNTLTRGSGTLFVIAAGNCFSTAPQQVSSPASADLALAVANLERDGSLAESSCRGPRAGDRSLKPEIAAPGSGIVAPRASGTDIGEPVGEHYTTLTGTSMATPHVAGVAALLRQQQPALHAEQLKTRLMTTADPQDGASVTGSGAGRVDADQATAGTVSVGTAEVDLGTLRWPHDNHPPARRPLTYRNDSAEPVTLDLSVQLDSGVTAAPPTLGASQLVVPAGGEATVDLTARFAPDHIGQVAGAVTAVPAGGGGALVTTFGWYSAPEEYRLTLNLTGLDGQPNDGEIALDRVDGKHLPFEFRFTTGGKLTVTVPPGKYAASAVIPHRATDTEPGKLALLVLPEFTVAADTSMHLDGRQAKPVSVQVRGRSDVRVAHTAMNYIRQGTDGWSASGFSIQAGPSWQVFATPTAKPQTGSAEFSLGGRHEVPPYRLRYADGTRAQIPVATADYSPRVDLDRSLVAADAGTAAPGELGDLRGKLAVIRLTDDRPAEEQIKAADSAGAAAIMLYTPQAPGLIKGFVTPGTTSRPVLVTSRAAAAELLDRITAGTIQVRLTGVRWSPVTYDLLRPWPDAIPRSPVLHPGQHEFAEVDTVIGTHSDRTGQTLIQEGRLGRTSFGGSTGGPLAPDAMVPAPARRTSYVLGGPVDWSVLLLESGLWQGGSLHWIDWFSTYRRYTPGQRSQERWFTPVAVTGLRDDGPIIPAVERYGSWMSVALSPFTHGDMYEPSYVPWGGPGTYAMRFSRNGQLVGAAEAPIEGFEIEPGAADFRIELDAQRDLPWWRHSTRVRSVWDFHSEDGEYVLPPLLAAGLTVPRADVLNRVTTGKPTAIGLTLRHQSGSQASDITSAALELSYDGSTWTRLPLRRSGPGQYLTEVTHPSRQAGKAPSLRVTATDAAGGKLTHEVSRAYTLVAR